MNRHGLLFRRLTLAAIISLTVLSTRAESRPIPRPLAHHPGHIFLANETVIVDAPANAQKWTLSDITGAAIANGVPIEGKATVGQPGVGFYRITWSPSPTETTDLAVLQPLTAPIAEDSPISINAALSIGYILGNITSPDDAANVLALAGINSGRDTAAWTWLVGDSGSTLSNSATRSSESLSLITRAYQKAGLQLLLLTEPGTPPRFQCSADWGSRPRKKLPVDLRDYAAYARELATQSGPNVYAYEAWNEPEGIGGGYLGSEIATAMKVFRLAVRSVAPTARVTMGLGQPPARTLFLNDYLSAVDNYDYHAHSHAERNRQRRRQQDDYTGDRPVWATEYSYGSYALQDRAQRRLSPAAEIQQAVDLPKIFVRALHDGNERIYYFCAFDFTEVSGQAWGLLRNKTLEPRPAFVAMAAAGRLLNSAKPLGALRDLPVGVEGWLMDGIIDGASQKIIVLWKNDTTPVACTLPPCESAWDLWGRQLPHAPTVIGPEPLYLVLKPNANVATTPYVKRSVRTEPRPLGISPVVADYRRPDRFKNRLGDYFLLTSLKTELAIDLYNFSPAEQKGAWKIETDDSVTALLPNAYQALAPGTRSSLLVQLSAKPTVADGRVHWIRLSGQFTDGPISQLVIPVVFCPSDLPMRTQRTVTTTGPALAWKTITPATTTATLQPHEDGILFSAQLGDAPNATIGTTWATAMHTLQESELIPAGAKAASIRLRATELPPGALLELHLIKRSGAAYACALPYNETTLRQPEGQRFLLPMTLFAYETYRKGGNDTGLNLNEITSCEISVSASPHQPIQLQIQQLSWIFD